MFGTIYTGFTGLTGFSRGLDVLSNNIANLNTPGFKSAELAFRDLFYRYSTSGNGDNPESSSQTGYGVDTPTTTLRFRQGELRETGNTLDVAIDGNGFLVLRRDDQYVYTRAGQLEFDAEGFLVERSIGAKLMALDNGALVPIDVDGLRASLPKATSEIVFVGNLSTGGTSHEIKDITVYDTWGVTHKLSVTFRKNPNVTGATAWFVEIRDQGATDPTKVIHSGEIRYHGNGSPLADFNAVTFDYAPDTNTPATSITLDFGDPNTFTGTTGFSGGTTSDVKVSSQNGYGVGALTKTAFDENGNLKLSYSNGQTAAGPRLALAWFTDLQALELGGQGVFVNRGTQRPILSGPAENVMGKIVSGKIELSNVDLTEQFTDMVIIQRGYQASSQVTTVANEMIQQLLDINRRG